MENKLEVYKDYIEVDGYITNCDENQRDYGKYPFTQGLWMYWKKWCYIDDFETFGNNYYGKKICQYKNKTCEDCINNRGKYDWIWVVVLILVILMSIPVVYSKSGCSNHNTASHSRGAR